MIGLVLCGGQSIRMGSDKGLLSHQDKLWAQLAGDKLLSLGLFAKYSINNDQQQQYANYFREQELVLDEVSLDLNGPLLGVLSAHLKEPEADLYVLACDLLLMEKRMMEKLMVLSSLKKTYDAYIFTKADQPEPLCGIYTAEALQRIMQLLKGGKLFRHSMKYILSLLDVLEVAIELEDYCCFNNFNSHAEINGL